MKYKNEKYRAVSGGRIKKRRKELGLRQEDLAEKLGVAKSLISRYESGSITPPIETYLELASILRTTAEDLIGLDLLETESSYKEEGSEIISELMECLQRVSKKATLDKNYVEHLRGLLVALRAILAEGESS